MKPTFVAAAFLAFTVAGCASENAGVAKAKAEAEAKAAQAKAEAELAKIQTAQAGIANVVRAVESFKLKKGYLPESLQQLILVDPEDGTPALLREKDLLDPWQRQYQYDPTRVHPANGRAWVESLGPNGQAGHPKLNSWN